MTASALHLPGFGPPPSLHAQARAAAEQFPLRPYQVTAVERIAEELRENRSTLLVMATGCHAKGQPILMFDGSVKAVEDVLVGDELMGPDSEPRRVLALARGEDEMVDIAPVKGEPWRVNLDHILTLVKTAQGRGRDGGEMIDVSVREWMTWGPTAKHIHKLVRARVDFPAQPSPMVHPWVLGLWLGDGTKSLRAFEISKPDVEIIEPLRRFAQQWGGTLVRRDNGTRCPTLTVKVGGGRGSSPLLREMRRLMADGVRIPDEYRLGSFAVRALVLSGLLDSDGALTTGGYDFISKSRELADDVAFVARSLGLAAYVSTCEKGCQTGAVGTYHRVSISGDCSALPLAIRRKRAPERKQKKDVLRTGFAVRPAGREKYYGFSLSGDGRFLLGDFTVTHNTGKTRVFGEVAKRHQNGRVLVLAHRKELVDQARARIAEITGEWIGVERGSEYRSAGERIICASKDSLHPDRLRRTFPRPVDVSLVIVDEAHHAVAKSYTAITDYFSSAKVLGVTATPDRGDEMALGAVFDSVAFVYEIVDGINDGFLCPIVGETANVQSLDLSHIKSKGGPRGDFGDGELGAALEEDDETLKAICSETIRLAGDRRTVLFFPTVETSKIAAGAFGVMRPGSAQHVDGLTPEDDRARILRGHKGGEYQFLCNVGVLTEGYDDPAISCVGIARPTKSRALYAQMVGRGTRIHPSKSDVLVLDYVANAGRHSLVGPTDLLGGKYDDEVVELAKKKGGNALEALERAKREIEDRKAHAERVAKAKAKTTTWQKFDPFKALGVSAPMADAGMARYDVPASDRQRAWLEKQKLIQPGQEISKREASKLCTALGLRINKGLASVPQMRALSKHGIDASRMYFKTASAVMDAIAKNGWRHPGKAAIDAIVSRGREPGEEG